MGYRKGGLMTNKDNDEEIGDDSTHKNKVGLTYLPFTRLDNLKVIGSNLRDFSTPRLYV